MNRKLGSLVTAAALAFTAFALPNAASAQTTAYNTSFQTSITYQNVGSGTANINFNFYREGEVTPVVISRQLAPNAGSSLFVGNLTELASFRQGSVAINSDQPIVATAVQIPAGTTPVRGRLLSNGSASGSNRQLIATVLKNRFNATTRFSVQNTGSAAANGTVRFFDAQNGGQEVRAAARPITNLPVGAARYFDAGQIAELPNGFNGSAVVEMTNGEVFASALELTTNTSGQASAFEGTTGGSNTVYMPSALCNAFGSQAQQSSYAVQNTGTATAQVTVTYSNGRTQSQSIPAGAKASFIACQAGVGNGFNGSATITSVGAPIVAVLKVYSSNANAGLYTAALGATSGAQRLALPYVRWSETRYDQNQRDRQRSFIAIQNVGSNIAAGQLRVRFINNVGQEVGAYTVPSAVAQGQKVNVTPNQIGAAGAEFGYYGTQFGGSAIVEGPAGSSLTAVVRVASFNGQVYAEDYNGIPIANQ